MQILLYMFLAYSTCTQTWFWHKETKTIIFDEIAQKECEQILLKTTNANYPDAQSLKDNNPDLYNFAKQKQTEMELDHIPIHFLQANVSQDLTEHCKPCYAFDKKNDLQGLSVAIIVNEQNNKSIEEAKATISDILTTIQIIYGPIKFKEITYANLHNKLKNTLEHDFPHSADLKHINPELYAECKKIQSKLGLEHVPIKFVHNHKDLATSTIGQCLHQGASGWNLKLGSTFCVMLNTHNQDTKNHSTLIIHHELTHVIQHLTGSEGVGYKKGIHNNNCGFIAQKKLNAALMEQAADAAALDSTQCYQCLKDFAATQRASNISAQMNEEGYCVSPLGYFSKEEVLEYADAAKLDFGNDGLCEKHKSKIPGFKN